MLAGTPRPDWITFDCYGTLVQWDEALRATAKNILAGKDLSIDAGELIEVYNRHKQVLEHAKPHRLLRDIAGAALPSALAELGVAATAADTTMLIDGISAIPPFPEVVATLGALKAADFRLCIITNSDDAIIAGTVAQLGDHIDRVVTAEQAGAYKPSRRIFDHAHALLGVTRDEVVHVCASPQHDLVATRALGIRDIWIDRGTGRRPLDGYTPQATLPTLDLVPGVFREAGWM